jgi:hypothetical protein
LTVHGRLQPTYWSIPGMYKLYSPSELVKRAQRVLSSVATWGGVTIGKHQGGARIKGDFLPSHLHSTGSTSISLPLAYGPDWYDGYDT